MKDQWATKNRVYVLASADQERTRPIVADDARRDVNGAGKRGTCLIVTSALTLLARVLLVINLNLDKGTKRNIMQSKTIDAKEGRTGWVDTIERKSNNEPSPFLP
jgi:hypothetical protein